MNELNIIALFFLILLPFIIGYLFTIKTTVSNPKGNIWLLNFSAGFILSVLFQELIPKIYTNHENTLYLTFTILLGFILHIIIDYLSKGVEHGHFHNKSNYAAYTIILGFGLHCFFEVFPLINVINLFTEKLYWSILIHNLPIVILFSIYLKPFKSKNKKITLLLLISSLSSLSIFILFCFKPIINNHFVTYSTCISIGILLHISTTILAENNENHKVNLLRILFVVSGIMVSLVI